MSKIKSELLLKLESSAILRGNTGLKVGDIVICDIYNYEIKHQITKEEFDSTREEINEVLNLMYEFEETLIPEGRGSSYLIKKVKKWQTEILPNIKKNSPELYRLITSKPGKFNSFLNTCYES